MLQEIPRRAIVAFSYCPPGRAVTAADGTEIRIPEAAEQCSANHQEVIELSPANYLTGGDLGLKIIFVAFA